MRIEIISGRKYKVGCNRGIGYIEKPNLLRNLNLITGKNLVPGDCFLLEGQVIAVDSGTKLILIVSETGPGALTRLWEERINPEFNISFGDRDLSLKVDWRDIEEIPGEFDRELRDQEKIGVWRRRFGKNGPILCEVESEDTIYPTHFCISKYSVKYKSSEFDEDFDAEYILNLLFGWFYDNFNNEEEEDVIEEEKEKSEEIN